MSQPYKMTLADLRAHCKLLASIEVVGHGSSVAGCQYVKGTEEMLGKNAAGEILLRVKGKITPARVVEFRNAYQGAVAAGIIKAPAPREIRHGVDGPDDPPGYANR